SIASSASSTWRASRWQAPPVTTACTSRDVWRASRSASFWVCTSPVTTAIGSSASSAASVRSSSSVFPEPGEETRLSATVPAAARRARTSAAYSSFFAIYRSRTSIVRTAIVELQVVEPQLVAGHRHQHRPRAGEGGHPEQGLQAEGEVLPLHA